MSNTYNNRKAKGICVNCEKTVSNGQVYCDDCKEQMRIKKQQQRDKCLVDGICTRCHNRKATKGYSTCEVCRNRSNKYQRDNRDKRNVIAKRCIDKKIALGLCPVCGKVNNNDTYLCPDCLESRRKDRQYYIDNGICPRCRREPLFGSEKSCPECRAKVTERMNKKYATNENFREQRRTYQKIHKDNLNQYRNENNLCTRCGRPLYDMRYKECPQCRAYLIEWARNKRREDKEKNGTIDRFKRVELELCYFCNNSAKDGFKVCEEHYQRMYDMTNSENAVQARKTMKENKVGFYKDMEVIFKQKQINNPHIDEPKKYDFFKGVYRTDKQLSKIKGEKQNDKNTDRHIRCFKRNEERF